jgi:DNA-binding MarR family transcriptional regulator
MSSIEALTKEISCDCLGSRARRLDRILGRIYDGALRAEGVTGAQLGLLVAVQRTQPASAVRLGRLLEMEKSTVSRNLARLVDAGLLSRGARGLIGITDRGLSVIRACHPLWRRAQAEARATLGDAAPALFSLLPPPGGANPTSRPGESS